MEDCRVMLDAALKVIGHCQRMGSAMTDGILWAVGRMGEGT